MGPRGWTRIGGAIRKRYAILARGIPEALRNTDDEAGSRRSPHSSLKDRAPARIDRFDGSTPLERQRRLQEAKGHGAASRREVDPKTLESKCARGGIFVADARPWPDRRPQLPGPGQTAAPAAGGRPRILQHKRAEGGGRWTVLAVPCTRFVDLNALRSLTTCRSRLRCANQRHARGAPHVSPSVASACFWMVSVGPRIAPTDQHLMTRVKRRLGNRRRAYMFSKTAAAMGAVLATVRPVGPLPLRLRRLRN